VLVVVIPVLSVVVTVVFVVDVVVVRDGGVPATVLVLVLRERVIGRVRSVRSHR
jgi:hypothetical protein